VVFMHTYHSALHWTIRPGKLRKENRLVRRQGSSGRREVLAPPRAVMTTISRGPVRIFKVYKFVPPSLAHSSWQSEPTSSLPPHYVTNVLILALRGNGHDKSRFACVLIVYVAMRTAIQ
jgi:hypothetical protein